MTGTHTHFKVTLIYTACYLGRDNLWYFCYLGYEKWEIVGGPTASSLDLSKNPHLDLIGVLPE